MITQQSLVKQSSMDDSMAFEDLENDSGPDDELRFIEEHQAPVEEEEYRPPTPRPSTPLPTSTSDDSSNNKGLPWVPKVRTKDIESFLDHTRMKFLGYVLHNDQSSLAGLPLPIHEGLKVLKQVSVIFPISVFLSYFAFVIFNSFLDLYQLIRAVVEKVTKVL